jgi:hypothetical protein
MAPPTISRIHLTDDTGAGEDGTVIDDALFQTLQDAIDGLSSAIVAAVPNQGNLDAITTAYKAADAAVTSAFQAADAGLISANGNVSMAYTPILGALSGTVPTIGNAQAVGRYLNLGPVVAFQAIIIGGTTTVWGSGNILTISLPSGVLPIAAFGAPPSGQLLVMSDAGGANPGFSLVAAQPNTCYFIAPNGALLAGNAPYALGPSWRLMFSGIYFRG